MKVYYTFGGNNHKEEHMKEEELKALVSLKMNNYVKMVVKERTNITK